MPGEHIDRRLSTVWAVTRTAALGLSVVGLVASTDVLAQGAGGGAGGAGAGSGSGAGSGGGSDPSRDGIGTPRGGTTMSPNTPSTPGTQNTAPDTSERLEEQRRRGVTPPDIPPRNHEPGGVGPGGTGTGRGSQ